MQLVRVSFTGILQLTLRTSTGGHPRVRVSHPRVDTILNDPPASSGNLSSGTRQPRLVNLRFYRYSRYLRVSAVAADTRVTCRFEGYPWQVSQVTPKPGRFGVEVIRVARIQTITSHPSNTHSACLCTRY